MRRLSTVLLAAGGTVLLIGTVVTLAPWYEALQWRNSPELLRAQRNADAAQPIWLTPTPADAAAQPRSAGSAARVQAPTPAPAAALRVYRRATPGAPGAWPPDFAPTPADAITAVPAPAPSQLELQYSDFRFLDPPEPGAAARLTVSVHNPTDAPSEPITLALPRPWLAGYAIESTQQQPSDRLPTRDQTADALMLTFDGPAADSDSTLTVNFKATEEVIDPPALQVLDTEGRLVGSAQPPTEAPPARPGPVWSVAIPRLNLRSGVTQVDWEPPLFVVGQVRTSAHVTEGNSVLVGHVRGAAGYNVFDHLDQLAVGDRVVATSRGQTYEFVVDKTEILPQDDTSPINPTSTPRLTLMTCAGDWNPFTRDYPDRLWVVAEPADVAAATLAGPARQPTPAPLALAQVLPRGGLGTTDIDLAAAFGAPVGESAGKLAVYPASGQRLEERAQFVDVPATRSRRAALVASIAQPSAPLTFDDAVRLSRGFLPKDAQPRAAAPEGHLRYFVERFTSPTLAALLPGEWFATRHAAAGDFLVVYGRRPDGHIAYVAVGIGDDAGVLSAAIDDAGGPSP